MKFWDNLLLRATEPILIGAACSADLVFGFILRVYLLESSLESADTSLPILWCRFYLVVDALCVLQVIWFNRKINSSDG